MNILISGASGLLGRALTRSLESAGHSVIKLSRKGDDTLPPCWDPANDFIDLGSKPFEVVIHLAGENISNGRWSTERKKKIMESRIKGTALLANALARSTVKPKVMITASAVGYYGNRGDAIMNESAASGGGFLAEVCREWEKAAESASNSGIRVVNTRFGMILSVHGGALEKMLTPFRMGLGGNIGSGRQYISWVSIDDVIGAMKFIIENDSISGPVNTVAPTPLTNREFTKILAGALHRPAFMTLPAFMARLIFGEMADELLLSSTRAVPRKLQEAGYRFQDPDLQGLFEKWFNK
ncbi:MAG: TIGR01777 family oxidoreductase [Proteobacteria bacterium]|nr:TIGR01777 family oxidoreductase [Pseudomonadota bacterium]MBU1737814.1 TIGR01777 family oxidoreductase [Pseudomonadota bacterium]